MAETIAEKQDLTGLNWTKMRDSSGTAGSFLNYSLFLMTGVHIDVSYQI